MAHNDKKFEKGMDKNERKTFEAQDEKNDATLAAKIKKAAKSRKAAAPKPKPEEKKTAAKKAAKKK